jgi:hypothetical protein
MINIGTIIQKIIDYFNITFKLNKQRRKTAENKFLNIKIN